MNNTILLPVNVLNPNTEVLKYAIFTAKNIGAKLLLFDEHLNPVSFSNSPKSDSGASKIRLEQAKKKLQNICERLHNVWKYTRTKLSVSEILFNRNGSQERLLVEAFSSQDSNLLLLGVKKDFSLSNELSIIKQQRIAAQSNCPVLLIPEGVNYSEVLHIDYVLDRKKPLSEIVGEINLLKKMTSVLYASASINILCFNKDRSATDFQLQKKILRANFEDQALTFTNYDKDDLEQVIQTNTAKETADMFVFPSENKSFIERINGVDQKKRLLLKSKIPVLVF